MTLEMARVGFSVLVFLTARKGIYYIINGIGNVRVCAD